MLALSTVVLMFPVPLSGEFSTFEGFSHSSRLVKRFLQIDVNFSVIFLDLIFLPLFKSTTPFSFYIYMCPLSQGSPSVAF